MVSQWASVQVGLSTVAVNARNLLKTLCKQDGKRFFGDRFLSQNFDDFTQDPAGAIGRIYDAMGMEMPQFDFSRVRPAKAPYEHDSPKWAEFAKALELPDV